MPTEVIFFRSRLFDTTAIFLQFSEETPSSGIESSFLPATDILGIESSAPPPADFRVCVFTFLVFPPETPLQNGESLVLLQRVHGLGDGVGVDGLAAPAAPVS